MTAEELYEIYVQARLDCGLESPTWSELDENEQQAWHITAEQIEQWGRE